MDRNSLLHNFLPTVCGARRVWGAVLDRRQRVINHHCPEAAVAAGGAVMIQGQRWEIGRMMKTKQETSALKTLGAERIRRKRSSLKWWGPWRILEGARPSLRGGGGAGGVNKYQDMGTEKAWGPVN